LKSLNFDNIPKSYPESKELDDGGFVLSSPAKINLGLRVIGKRDDGFHDLETIFQEVTLADEIEFHQADSWTLEIRGADLPTDSSNLVNKAAVLLSELYGCPLSGHVILHKKIPIGGGLGGGSSNATVALFGLSRLWGLNVNHEKIFELSCKLGSDCAFFVYGGLARAQGRGERLSLLSGRISGEILIITPPYSISTAWAFRVGRFPLTNPDKNVILALYSCNFSDSVQKLEIAGNDFERIVFTKFTELDSIKRKLLDFNAKVSMLSGSGSSIYGVFDERSQALQAAQQFGDPMCVFLCQPVNRDR
jgi:4-diphosphocytidyl-2-C-methyl-D-erythritol kinase